MEFVRRWIEDSGYTRALGVKLEELGAEHARLAVAYRDENSNPGRALHGGVAASLAVVGAHALARSALGEAAGPFHTVAVQVDYLAAALGEDVESESTLLRRGKELCFVESEVRTRDGKSLAHATLAVRGRFGAAPAEPILAHQDAGESDPGPMGPRIGTTPFIASRGIRVEHMTGGCSRLVMPFSDANADSAGGVHEGAVLALLDTAGAMASWAETGPGAFRASTPAMQAQVLAEPSRADLVAYGRVTQRDGEIFWSDVEVGSSSDGRLVARGTVIYRIVT